MINEESGDRTVYSEGDPLLSVPIKQDAEIVAEKGKAIGTKSLNTFYSILFIINQIYGPGVLAIPIVFQQGMKTHYAYHPFTLSFTHCMLPSSSLTCLLSLLFSLITHNRRLAPHYDSARMLLGDIMLLFNPSMWGVVPHTRQQTIWSTYWIHGSSQTLLWT